MTSPPKKKRPVRRAPPKNEIGQRFSEGPDTFTEIDAEIAAAEVRRMLRGDARATRERWQPRLDDALTHASSGFARAILHEAFLWPDRKQNATKPIRDAIRRERGLGRGALVVEDEIERMACAVIARAAQALLAARSASSTPAEAENAKHTIKALYNATRANGGHDAAGALVQHVIAWAERRRALGHHRRAADDLWMAHLLAADVDPGFAALGEQWEDLEADVGRALDLVRIGRRKRSDSQRRPNGAIEAAVALNNLAGCPLGPLTTDGLASTLKQRSKRRTE